MGTVETLKYQILMLSTSPMQGSLNELELSKEK